MIMPIIEDLKAYAERAIGPRRVPGKRAARTSCGNVSSIAPPSRLMVWWGNTWRNGIYDDYVHYHSRIYEARRSQSSGPFRR